MASNNSSNNIVTVDSKDDLVNALISQGATPSQAQQAVDAWPTDNSRDPAGPKPTK